MSIQKNFERLLSSFAKARTEPLAKHPIATLIRVDIQQQVAAIVADEQRYKCEGSPGKGNWNSCPWVAVFDRLITVSAQEGMYPVYLFREDMTGVYLSLNQAMTEAKARYKADAKTSLQARAANVQAYLGASLGRFNTKTIDLRSGSLTSSSSYYEAGNICSVFYGAGQVPSDSQCAADLLAMLEIYERASDLEGMTPAPGARSSAATTSEGFEDGTKRRKHERIERNYKLSSDAKKVHGYRCQACDFDFTEVYGILGHEYIEAHHLVPLATIQGKRVSLDPKKDFAVLCANCHRMVHRSEFFGDIQKFKETYLHAK